MASRATESCVCHSSFASCSTQPGCGKNCVNSFCARLRILPLLSNRMQRLLVVPASSAITYFFMIIPQSVHQPRPLAAAGSILLHYITRRAGGRTVQRYFAPGATFVRRPPRCSSGRPPVIRVPRRRALTARRPLRSHRRRCPPHCGSEHPLA